MRQDRTVAATEPGRFGKRECRCSVSCAGLGCSGCRSACSPHRSWRSQRRRKRSRSGSRHRRTSARHAPPTAIRRSTGLRRHDRRPCGPGVRPAPAATIRPPRCRGPGDRRLAKSRSRFSPWTTPWRRRTAWPLRVRLPAATAGSSPRRAGLRASIGLATGDAPSPSDRPHRRRRAPSRATPRTGRDQTARAASPNRGQAAALRSARLRQPVND